MLTWSRGRGAQFEWQGVVKSRVYFFSGTRAWREKARETRRENLFRMMFFLFFGAFLFSGLVFSWLFMFDGFVFRRF